MSFIARARDRHAFAAMFAHFAPREKAYLMRLGTDAGQAEDPMQDVMLTVWRRAGTCDPGKAGARGLDLRHRAPPPDRRAAPGAAAAPFRITPITATRC